ncbi:uncharacterized NAD/FAD-dependent dehydrogenase [Candidatus Vecturithrix granuli]|uniref:Uncharacterized NAD/FAD-dependent dehydrogenase n=1 Tax=Vecturithrix granuli TaxID=1499967 RepID=A0A081C962_VECG1|nr:uncharacterized NAD/FAD-dependent dehydrogenase [Candidatus Vecturithrix granuli]
MEYKDVVVAKVSEIQPGDMKQIAVEGGEILLVNIDGQVSALGAHCTHYGAELAKGTLVGDTIVCPWHQACFCAKSGDLKEPPALNALPSYDVTIQGDDIVVKLPEKLKKSRIPDMASYNPQNDIRTFVIVGAGAAGNAAAQTLREDGFQGRIIMISHEPYLPYDRPNLDKAYLQGEAPKEWLPLRSEKFYQNRDIELMLSKTVIKVDVTTKTITFQDQETLQYDKVLLATGGIPRRLDVPGADLPNVVTLRSLDDADALIHDCEHASRIVVIGASFIGLESAFSLKKRGLDVTVAAPEKVPFASIFGEEIGTMIQQSYVEQGIQFQLGKEIFAFEGQNYARAIVFRDGDQIEADLFLLGVGVIPNTGYLQGIDVQPDGSIQVDEYFQAAADVYAAGDIARFPDWRSFDKAQDKSRDGIRIEHWRTAEQQGRDAAHNMAGKQVANQSVPFFWSKQTDFNIRYVGYAKDWEEVILDGDLASKKFLAFYIKHGKVYAVAGAKRDQEMAAIHELMRLNKMPTPDELRGKPLNILDLVK